MSKYRRPDSGSWNYRVVVRDFQAPLLRYMEYRVPMSERGDAQPGRGLLDTPLISRD